MKIVLRTKDLQTILYSIARQIKFGDKFGYNVFDLKQESVEILQECSIIRNEIEVLRIIGKIKKYLSRKNAMLVSINELPLCKIIKSEKEFIVEDYSNKLLDFVFFEMIRECKCIKVEYMKKCTPKLKESHTYVLKSTYETDSIINYDNIYDTFCSISESVSKQLYEVLEDGENYIVNITTKFLKDENYSYTFTTEVCFKEKM